MIGMGLAQCVVELILALMIRTSLMHKRYIVNAHGAGLNLFLMGPNEGLGVDWKPQHLQQAMEDILSQGRIFIRTISNFVMIEVMKILKAAAGPNRVPEFQSTHPDPENRIEKIQEAIQKYSGR